ncbi:MAG: hypothetical protein K9W43_00010 [Candidatus Thorarchaeota archaeon]|nr:hypothetical protein [Candidatus Thorarchaeota archaeon]
MRISSRAGVGVGVGSLSRIESITLNLRQVILLAQSKGFYDVDDDRYYRYQVELRGIGGLRLPAWALTFNRFVEILRRARYPVLGDYDSGDYDGPDYDAVNEDGPDYDEVDYDGPDYDWVPDDELESEHEVPESVVRPSERLFTGETHELVEVVASPWQGIVVTFWDRMEQVRVRIPLDLLLSDLRATGIWRESIGEILDRALQRAGVRLDFNLDGALRLNFERFLREHGVKLLEA